LFPPQSVSTTRAPVGVPVIALRADGEIRFEGAEVDDAGLATKLAAVTPPPEKVAIHADAVADAARVADVVDVVYRAGIAKVGILTVHAPVPR
jgi:biopolymer transport protein ExbD